MKHLNKLRVALCAAAVVVAVAFFACNKEKEPATQRQNALCDIKTPSQNNWDVRNDRINLTRSASGSGYWDYSTGGFHVTEFLPLWDLVHWRDFNDCEYGLLVAEGIVDVAAFLTAPLTGGLSAFLFTSFNSYAFNWMRKNVCN